MKTFILPLVLMLSSCSTLKKSIVSGAMVGGLVGGTGGAVFSPNEESTNKNAYLGGVIGAVAGAGIAYLMHDKKPKKEKHSLLLDDHEIKQENVPLFDFSDELKNIKPEVNFKPVKKYEVPLEKLPPELEGKVKKQFIIEYKSEARTLDLGNRTIQISPFKAWEHVYEQ
ncbi:MAG: hypothetical protein CME62_14985 [Halobacteriovoraceae bacterium]|nr:hypothetical protein [Halobacteriovoraceae bacterium]|tara:strand:- start:1822 stop:2328 length:507 start_codon:yes stop_codon:yes gene_type:complete